MAAIRPNVYAGLKERKVKMSFAFPIGLPVERVFCEHLILLLTLDGTALSMASSYVGVSSSATLSQFESAVAFEPYLSISLSRRDDFDP